MLRMDQVHVIRHEVHVEGKALGGSPRRWRSAAMRYECRVFDFIRYDCGDFLGREALLKIKERGPAKKLMGLEVGGGKLAPGDQPLMIGSESVGRVVAGFHSPNLDRNLGYAYVNAPHFGNGTKVTLEIDGIGTAATIVDMPFLDPAGKRMRI